MEERVFYVYDFLVALGKAVVALALLAGVGWGGVYLIKHSGDYERGCREHHGVVVETHDDDTACIDSEGKLVTW